MIDSFIFYASFYEALQEIDDPAVRLAVYDAIASYALTGQEPNLKDFQAALFRLIKPQIDANNRRREDGAKGGRPKKEKPMVSKDEEKEKPMVSESAKTEKPVVSENSENKKPNVNANANANVNANIYKAVVNSLNLHAGTMFSAKSDATKRLIDARLHDGYDFADFDKVIETKCKEWKGTEMEKFLRPQTLFGTKFESYLQQKPVKRKQQAFDERTYNAGELESLVPNALDEVLKELDDAATA